MNSHQDPSAALAAMAGSFIFFGIFSLVALAFGIVVQWKIATKAGYAGALSLLMLVPLVNIVILILFAFTEWPIERALRAAGGGFAPGTGNPPSGGYVPTGGAYTPPAAGYIPPGGGGYAPPVYPGDQPAQPWNPPPEQLPPPNA